MHIPVLLQEVIEFLKPEPGKKYIDATIGMGGHAMELAKRGAEVLGIDRDPSVVQNLSLQDPSGKSAPKIVHGSFANLKEIAEENDFTEADGVLFDLGMGSHQLDHAARGFSFQQEGPLDMRFNGEQELRAEGIVNGFSEKELARIFHAFGEEKRFGKRIARAIVVSRKFEMLKTTTDLFNLIKRALPGTFRFKAADVSRRIFQSLRIAVNDELGNLEKALPQAVHLLKKGGRLAVISFHSLEDRIVKQFFAKEAKNCVCPTEFPVCRCEARATLRILTKKPITAEETEIKTNPRAKSAKLRAAQKL